MVNMNKNQNNLLKMKIIMSDIKNILYGINNRLHTTKENISEPENIKIETIQNKSQRKKNTKKPHKYNITKLSDNFKKPNNM